MTPRKIVALLLIAAGVLGLAYGTLTYTSETHKAELGSVELAVKEKETVNIPSWAGVGAVTIGALLLVMRTKR